MFLSSVTKKGFPSKEIQKQSGLKRYELVLVMFYKLCKAIVFTEKSTSYKDISDYAELHLTEKFDEQPIKENLRWVHITISCTKRNFPGNCHKIKGKYLQLYLTEFVYNLNRGYFKEKLFNWLAIPNITRLGLIADIQKNF